MIISLYKFSCLDGWISCEPNSHIRRRKSLPSFIATSGPQIDCHKMSPFDIFCLYFDQPIWSLILKETEIYRLQINSKISRVEIAELQAYVGLKILMGLCSKPAVEDYWSTLDAFESPFFQRVMTRRRFQEINSLLHFADNEKWIPKGQPSYDPFYKIREMHELLMKNFQACYVPNRCVAADESLTSFKGRCSFWQAIRTKRARFGIRSWRLADSETGYLIQCTVYAGKSNYDVAINNNKELFANRGLGESVIFDLLQSLPNCNHVVYSDNFYTSPQLVSDLYNMGYGAVGIVRADRKGLPSAVRKKNLTKLPKNSIKFYFKDPLLLCAMHDRRHVLGLSSIHDPQTTEVIMRDRFAESFRRTVAKPTLLADYNAKMGPVDLGDQISHCYPVYPHRCSKWTHRWAHQLINDTLMNAAIMFKLARDQESPVNRKFFNLSIVESLCEPLLRECHISVTVQIRHKLLPNLETEGRNRCRYCQRFRQSERRTRWICGECNAPLCKTCFNLYHSLLVTGKNASCIVA